MRIIMPTKGIQFSFGSKEQKFPAWMAFNESTRLVHCLKMHKRLFGVDARKVCADTGYAGTENRDYCKKNGIQTSFVKRGRPFSEEKKDKDLVRRELARVRAAAMEGSFGTQKTDGTSRCFAQSENIKR